MAEGVGFEPTIRFPVYTLSRRAPSTARPSLRQTVTRGRGGAGRRRLDHFRLGRNRALGASLLAAAVLAKPPGLDILRAMGVMVGYLTAAALALALVLPPSTFAQAAAAPADTSSAQPPAAGGETARV